MGPQPMGEDLGGLLPNRRSGEEGGCHAVERNDMIQVTRFDHTELILNADLIEFIEALPDTHITLVTGKKLLVRESPLEVVDRVIAYRQAAGPMLRNPTSAALCAEHDEAA